MVIELKGGDLRRLRCSSQPPSNWGRDVVTANAWRCLPNRRLAQLELPLLRAAESGSAAAAPDYSSPASWLRLPPRPLSPRTAAELRCGALPLPSPGA